MATGKGNAYATAYLKLIFQNIRIANLGDAEGVRGSDAPGYLYLSLHTGDPGADGSQLMSEAAYPGYARVPVPRTEEGFVVIAQTVKLARLTSFPKCIDGDPLDPEIETYVGIGRDPTGPGEILYRAKLATVLPVFIGLTPQIDTTLGLTES